LEPGEEFVFINLNNEYVSCIFGLTNFGADYLAENGFWYRYIITEDKTGTGSCEEEKIYIIWFKTIKLLTICNFRFWIFLLVIIIFLVI